MANNDPFYLQSPYGFDNAGRTAAVSEANHLRSLIEAVLFTTPGERVNRPDFGSGLSQMIFTPAGDELAATTQFLVQSSLQRWLGDLIRVETVQVSIQDSSLTILVQYTLVKTREPQIQIYKREVPA